MNEYGFDLAFLAERDLTPDIGYYLVYHQKAEWITNETSGELIYNITNTEVDFEICGDNSLNYSNIEEIKTKGFDTYYCIKNKSEFYFGGSYFADAEHAFYIQIINCINSTDSAIICASQTTQAEYF